MYMTFLLTFKKSRHILQFTTLDNNNGDTIVQKTHITINLIV